MNSQQQEQLLKRNAELQQELAVKNRELEIESALEKVRAPALNMKRPGDLLGICEVLFKELCALGFDEVRNTMVNIYNDTKESLLNYDFSADGGAKLVTVSYNGSSVMETFIQQTKRSSDAFTEMIIAGDELEDWKTIRENNGEQTGQKLKNASILYYYYFSFGTGVMGISSFVPVVKEQLRILERFKNVFTLSYQRYTDIAKAEAQAREAQIEAALERVRAKALTMQKSDDLFDVVNVLREEMGGLGQRELESSIVHLYNDDAETIQAWFAYRPPNLSSGEIVIGYNNISKQSTQWAREVIARYKSTEIEYTIVSSGEKLHEWYMELEKIAPDTIDYDDNGRIIVPEILYYHFSNFSGGSLLMISNQAPSEESRELQKKAAVVFELAYTRYLDLQKAEQMAHQAELDLIKLKEEKKRTEHALAELKSTQVQLIQSEKMASLGELTAGIAHEIQNPLNFVNNFSEVNNELIDEMKKELLSGNIKEAISIADDIVENEQKIMHHGKRADAIVKGMLQHSRASTGQKESVDINKLTDEYLRLSYHGFRAKDKNFNARLETHFDESIGKIYIVPQDMGRVLLNLFNNAFYAIIQKRKYLDGNYEPTVSVSTRKEQDQIKIIVRDNGTGIPHKVVDKVFQPFFTTKPTGQGTGLGLSLSYDIIKAHGGEIKVKTKEGEYTEFSFELPAS